MFFLNISLTLSVFVFLAVQEHKPAGEVGLWDPDQRGGLQVAAGLHQKRTGSQRLQEPDDLQCKDQGLSHGAGEDERAVRDDGSARQVMVESFFKRFVVNFVHWMYPKFFFFFFLLCLFLEVQDQSIGCLVMALSQCLVGSFNLLPSLSFKWLNVVLASKATLYRWRRPANSSDVERFRPL